MPATYAEVSTLASVVYDQDTHSDADMAFLESCSKANCEWIDACNAANLHWGGGSQMWGIIKALATRSRDAAYVKALAVLEAADGMVDA